MSKYNNNAHLEQLDDDVREFLSNDPRTWTDEEVLKLVLFLVEFKGLQMGTAFQPGEDSPDVFTHEILEISCGDMTLTSSRTELNPPVMGIPFFNSLPANRGKLN